jgi:hypothetical protein
MIKLAIALPLVVCAPVDAYPVPGAPTPPGAPATADADTNRFPHLAQNCDPSSIISPQ